MKIITALGNQKINEELKKDSFYNVIGVDIQYQEGIFEILEKNKNINYIILNLDLIGELNKYDLIKKIKEKNNKINLIIILEKENEKIKDYLLKNNINLIINKKNLNINLLNNILKNNLNKNKVNNKTKKLNKIIKKINNYIKNKKNKIKKIILNKKNKIIKLVYLIKIIKNIFKIKINKKINRKIITIIGDRKCGKTIFIILFSKIINKKILIINLDNKKELNIMLGKKSKNDEEFLKINKKIELINCNLTSINREDLKNKFIEYNYVLIDTSGIEELQQIKKIENVTDYFILIIDPNLIGINNSNNILDIISKNKKIKNKKNNIKIIINKNNFYSINEKIINYIFSDFKIIGKINYNNKYNFLINNNFKLINKKIKKEYLKIIKEVEIL